jgi:ribonuclease P protein component
LNAQFKKREHLVSTRLIETLFSSGSYSMSAFPLRAVFKKVSRSQIEVPVQILISVPKKRFKHAVDRNRVKRQVREAYRHCKQPLFDAIDDNESLLLAFLWISDRQATSATVARQVERLVGRIAEML